MACVSSTRVLGGWLWSRRSRWPCHGMSKVSVLFIDGGTHRKSGFVIGRYGNMIPRLAERAVHCTRIFPLPPPSFRCGPLSSLGTLPPHPHHCALQPSRERETENLHALVHPQRRISLCISSRRATCETCVPHETLYLTAFVSPMSEKRSRPFTYLLPRFDTTRVSVDSFLPSFLHSLFFLEKLLRRLFNFGRFDGKSCVLCIPLTKG